MTKLLLVEDDRDNARMIARLLSLRGFETSVAESGEEAIRMVGEMAPDAIIMDLALPGGMSGLDATHAIKSAPETKAIPIIILSASTLASFRTQAFEAGADDVDTKPVEVDRLTGKINALLHQSET